MRDILYNRIRQTRFLNTDLSVEYLNHTLNLPNENNIINEHNLPVNDDNILINEIVLNENTTNLQPNYPMYINFEKNFEEFKGIFNSKLNQISVKVNTLNDFNKQIIFTLLNTKLKNTSPNKSKDNNIISPNNFNYSSDEENEDDEDEDLTNNTSELPLKDIYKLKSKKNLDNLIIYSPKRNVILLQSNLEDNIQPIIQYSTENENCHHIIITYNFINGKQY